jgi:ABC-type nitrate/sulfonate/bicarbonate transport system substrate-binding protein
MIQRRHFTAALVAAPLMGCHTAPSAPISMVKLRVKVFPGAQNLGQFAALSQGFFSQQGLDVDLQFTQNSVELRDGLASGSHDIAHSAVDNAVAMRELAGHDIVIMSGGDNSMNEMFVQPEYRSVAQLKGKTLIVDAPNTAYALQAKKILKTNGLGPNDYLIKELGGTFARFKAMREDKSNAASMLNLPFSLQAHDAGLRSLGFVADLLGSYQASGAFAMRKWAQANGQVVERYLAGYIAGLRWALNPTNKAQTVQLLQARLSVAEPLAERTYAALVDKRYGLTPDARLDPQGFANVLALRAEIEGQWGGRPPAQDRYVDLSWYHNALKRLG